MSYVFNYPTTVDPMGIDNVEKDPKNTVSL